MGSANVNLSAHSRRGLCALMQQLLWAPLLKLPGDCRLGTVERRVLRAIQRRGISEKPWLLAKHKHTSAGLCAGLLAFRQLILPRRRERDRGEGVSGRAGTERRASVEFRAQPYAS